MAEEEKGTPTQPQQPQQSPELPATPPPPRNTNDGSWTKLNIIDPDKIKKA